MHRKQNTDLIPADTELEKTLRSLRKIKKAENSTMADERQDQNEVHREAARRPPIADTMEDFWKLIIQDEYSSIRQTYTAHEIGAVEREILKGSAERAAEEQFYDAEEVKYLGEQRNYHFKPNTNLPTHYHPALRNHENFSYGGGASQGPRHGQNPPQGYQQPPRFQQQQQEMNKETNIKVRGGPNLLKNRCCSSWGIIRSC